MASNNGYPNIPQSVKTQIMQTINSTFQSQEVTALLTVIDLMFQSFAKRATLAGSAATGFSNMTGTNDKTGLATGTATTAQLAGRIKAIEDALKANGSVST